MHKRSGFTLIELLVVISIIGLLSSVVLAALSTARKKARDARRMADIKSIQLALELYRDRFGAYPPAEPESTSGPPAGCWGWDTSFTDFGGDGYPFIPALATSGIIAKVPTDPVYEPIGSDCDVVPGYKYARYGAGTNLCPLDKGPYYVMEVNVMEMIPENQQHPLSPGFKCGTNDWGTGGAYTMGSFEN
jgi:prepilin-type N-terminal cleavage/methylation domain-containing protein